jgi:beta-1,2-mannosidase
MKLNRIICSVIATLASMLLPLHARVQSPTTPTPEKLAEVHALWMLQPFVKHAESYPLIRTDSSTLFDCPVTKNAVAWEGTFVFNPAAIVRDEKVYLIYRGEDNIGRHGGTSRIGIAVSEDGINFKKHPRPVLYPDNDPFLEFEREGGCEDPRIVESEEGTYILTYTAFDGHVARLLVASSQDLFNWTKHGPAFGRAQDGAYRDLWSKSGSIICRRVGDKLIATKINGRYWMYWGETDIYLATSDNLIDWEPVLKEEKTGKRLAQYLGEGRYDIQFGEPKVYFKTALEIRENRFDSHLVEPGPPAIITDIGILFIYNGSNSRTHGVPWMQHEEYTVGQVMFDLKDPSAVIARCDSYFLRSEDADEVVGQMTDVMFTEALVHFQGRWLLYYATGEANIGVAICDSARY